MDNKDPITGEWDATMSMPNQSQELRMILMLDGSQVSGRVESPAGVYMFEGGEFAHDYLKLFMPSAQGEMELVAHLEDGKLVGEYSVADREQGAFEAVRV